MHTHFIYIYIHNLYDDDVIKLNYGISTQNNFTIAEIFQTLNKGICNKIL